MWSFRCAAVEEFLPSLKNVVDAHLDVLKNIQKQNGLEEWE